jgi:hypothetical protein
MIDDVTYLIENSEKSSQIVYIDSTIRNKFYYPNANNYIIDFDQPFKLVYGFDIIDSTIPVTMYNIDIYNNTFYYTVVTINSASITPINPDLFFKELTDCLSFQNLYNDVDSSTYCVLGSDVQLNSYIGVVSNPSGFHFMYIRKYLITDKIILKTNQIHEEYFFFTYSNIKYAIRNINQNIIDIIKTGEYSIILNNDGTYNLKYFIKYDIDSSTFTAITQANLFIISVQNIKNSIAIGNYNILTVINTINDAINPYMDIVTTTANPSQEAKMLFSSANQIYFNGNKGLLCKSLGFDTYPALSIYNNINFIGWTIGNNFQVFGGIYDSSIPGYKIVSPGLITLLGERFSILRIKEIEDHLYGSYAYMGMTPGIGLFKMAATFGGITNLRFDYTTLIKRAFHPIGKLSRLSITWETSTQGQLYDFKGVNHQFLALIKFYVPSTKFKYTRSILNPNYEPDVMQYMAKNRTIQNKEDSDDEEEFDEEEYYQTYKKELDKYEYSSSEGDASDKTEDSEQDIQTYMQNHNLLS